MFPVPAPPPRLSTIHTTALFIRYKSVSLGTGELKIVGCFYFFFFSSFTLSLTGSLHIQMVIPSYYLGCSNWNILVPKIFGLDFWDLLSQLSNARWSMLQFWDILSPVLLNFCRDNIGRYTPNISFCFEYYRFCLRFVMQQLDFNIFRHSNKSKYADIQYIWE